MPRILLEDTFDFKPDRAAIVESKNPDTGITSKRIPGTLSVCDCINGNRRRYSKKVWEKNLAEGSVLKGLMSRRASFGLLEHPADGKVDLRSPISHITVDAQLTEGKDDKGAAVVFVKGVIEVLDTPEGKKLSSLIEAGYDPLVSSRGYGTLVTASDGVDDVQEDFVCEGWDVVSTPSFVQAALKPARAEKQQEARPIHAPAQESAKPISAPAPSSVKPIAETQKHVVMDLKSIRESIGSLKAIQLATIDARTFAEGLQRMTELHNAAAKHLSENASASWEVGQLHKELTTLEEAFIAAFEAPRLENKKLGENQTKLLSVVKGLASVVSESRKVLSECRGKLVKSNEIAEAVAKRGRAWMETARRERDGGKVFEQKYSFCTEALDIMATRYKSDVAELGARVLELEFPSMTEDQKKALGEAKTPKAVLAVRESVEKKPDAAAKPAAVEEAKKPDAAAKPADAAAKPAAVEEAKKPAEAAKPVEEAKKPADEVKAPALDPKAPARPMTEGVEILRTDVTHSVSESMGMARRLSQGQAALRS